jgi:hypothetical protein
VLGEGDGELDADAFFFPVFLCSGLTEAPGEGDGLPLGDGEGAGERVE